MLKRIYMVALAGTIACLCACSEKPQAPVAENTSHPIYLKDHVTDRQMIRDLNVCANEVFQDSMDDTKSDRDSEKEAQKECMRSKGYEVVYN